MEKINPRRILWLDLIKGFLIIMVVIYHLGYDLSEIHDVNFNIYNPFFDALRVFGASLFIMICGISSNLSRNNLKRGVILFIIALLITLISYLFDSSYYVKFGILHLLGTLTILYHFYQKASYKLLGLFLIVSIIITLVIYNIKVDVSYLFPLGLYNSSFITSDYYPIFGYIIFFILGNIIGKYIKTKEILYKWQKTNILTFFGKYSLIIYLIHQPILIGLLYLLF